jgi:hypothetical protein
MAKQFIYAEILNKTSLAMMIRRDFFIYYQVIYLCCISFCFVCVTGYIYFIFAHDPARTFISKKIFFILVYFYKRNLLISILNLLTLALLTVNLPMSTRPTVLYTKKGYGMIIFVPIKKKK